eukprot:scaffold6722_cov173-Amphora_coffeaeformis.AAC.5
MTTDADTTNSTKSHQNNPSLEEINGTSSRIFILNYVKIPVPHLRSCYRIPKKAHGLSVLERSLVFCFCRCLPPRVPAPLTDAKGSKWDVRRRCRVPPENLFWSVEAFCSIHHDDHHPPIIIVKRVLRHTSAPSPSSSSGGQQRTTSIMKFQFSLTAWSILAVSVTAFMPAQTPAVSTTALNMVLEKPKEKKLPKIEVLKIESDHLVHPLKEQYCTDVHLNKDIHTAARMPNQSQNKNDPRIDELILSPSDRYLQTT